MNASPRPLTLASSSPYRLEMLRRAGLAVEAVASSIDERAAETPLIEVGAEPEDIASVLAEAKAANVSDRAPGLVVGADQVLALDGNLLHKPRDMEEARRRLLTLSGRTHQLHSAAVLSRDGETIWRHVSTAQMTMRELDPGFVGRHLAAVGDVALTSVGAYQIEGPGAQLFERIEGDLFTIIGLPLLPLLAELRRLDAIDN